MMRLSSLLVSLLIFILLSTCVSAQSSSDPEVEISCSPSNIQLNLNLESDASSKNTKCTVSNPSQYTERVELNGSTNQSLIFEFLEGTIFDIPPEESIEVNVTISTSEDVPIGNHAFTITADVVTANGVPTVNDASQSVTLSVYVYEDSDDDGFADLSDNFPMDPTQWSDLDGDGYGDNSNGNYADGCPLEAGISSQDQFGCPDTDEDGFSDKGDLFPMDATQWSDADRDGFGDNSNGNSPDDCPQQAGSSFTDRLGCPDTDGDGYSNSGDAFPNDPDRVADDLGSTVVYVFTGDASAMQYIGILMSATGLFLTITLGLRRTVKGKSSDKHMQSLLIMIESSLNLDQLNEIKSAVDEKFVRKEITGEHHTFLNGKIMEKSSSISDSSGISSVHHNVVKHISYNIQDSVISGAGPISDMILPDLTSKGVVKDGYEWLEYEGNRYYRPVTQPNTQWTRWQG
tara:strand:+ start:254 stop:1630 length:1377 start_codon:yes stop_codon:yes gene_type:complete